MWLELSKDEPENQVPPANLEQLIAMLTREVSRRFVHFVNYSANKLVTFCHQGFHTIEVCVLNAIWWADYVIKVLYAQALYISSK